MTSLKVIFQDKRTLFSRLFIGALIGLGFISLFVFDVENPDPEWGPNWQIRPLIITPLFGAIGMLFFYIQDFFKPKGELAATSLIAAEVALFAFSIYLGIVLGLDGTLWN